MTACVSCLFISTAFDTWPTDSLLDTTAAAFLCEELSSRCAQWEECGLEIGQCDWTVRAIEPAGSYLSGSSEPCSLPQWVDTRQRESHFAGRQMHSIASRRIQMCRPTSLSNQSAALPAVASLESSEANRLEMVIICTPFAESSAEGKTQKTLCCLKYVSNCVGRQ